MSTPITHRDPPAPARPQVNLGCLLEAGRGVAADVPRAMAYYEEGAAVDDRVAQARTRRGSAYRTGKRSACAALFE
jgi:TPR repeat protein